MLPRSLSERREDIGQGSSLLSDEAMERVREIRPVEQSRRSIDGLIRTKINVPPLKSKLVERGHLFDKLAETRNVPLAVVFGVPASGKTSLVCQWINREGLKAAWYSLDKADNDSALFFRYLLASLCSADSKLASLVSADMRDGRAFTEKQIVSYLVQHLGSLSSDIYLVLDDYHVITSRAIHATLIDFITLMPSNMHIVILTRSSIPFPLPSLRVKNQVVEISAPEMQFTEQEVERFFTDIIPVNLTTQEVHEIGKHMEGWVGGLQLLGLSLKEKELPEELGDMLGKSKRQAWEYLMDEVINVQSSKVRVFLEATAPLDRFSVEVAREMTGLPDAGDILEAVYRQNLFLVPLDGAHKWHRYHHLLSEAIVERMRLSSPGKLTALHQQAALWFARNGYLEDAFQNAFASEDFEFAADLMEDYMLHINDRYEYASGSRWLARLPEHVFRSRALLLLHDCGQKIETFQLADVEAVIVDIEKDREHAFDRYTGYKRTYCEDVSTYFSYVLRYYYKDPTHPDPEQLEKAFLMISSENRLFAGYLKTVIAWSYISLCNPQKAEAALAEALPLIISSGKLWARVLWFRLAATVQRIQGHLRTSEAILREGFEFLEQRKLAETPLRYVLYVPLAWVHFHRNEIGDASRYAAAATSYGEHVGFVRDVAEGNLLLSLTNMVAGRIKEADDCLRKIRLATGRQGVPETGFSTEAWFAHLSMIEGDLRYATEWMERRRPSADGPLSVRLIRDCMAQVELLIRQRHCRKAESILMKLRPRCIDRGMMEAVLDIDIARSAALYADKHYERARQVMEDALAFAETEGYIRPFLNYASMIFPLLSDMRADDLGLRPFLHLKTVMAAFAVDDRGLVGSTTRFREDRSKGLTEREVEILRLMAAGHRYQEIARRMFISLETVKTHVKHVFRKLEVKSKTQAIRRAQDLRLLGE